MSSANHTRRVIVIGLDPYRVPGPWDPAPVAGAIEAGLAGLAQSGFLAESCLVGLDGAGDIEPGSSRHYGRNGGTALWWGAVSANPRN